MLSLKQWWLPQYRQCWVWTFYSNFYSVLAALTKMCALHVCFTSVKNVGKSSGKLSRIFTVLGGWSLYMNISLCNIVFKKLWKVACNLQNFLLDCYYSCSFSCVYVYFWTGPDLLQAGPLFRKNVGAPNIWIPRNPSPDSLHPTLSGPTRTVVIIDILLRTRAAMHTTIAAAADW